MRTLVSSYDALIDTQVPGDKARDVAEALESDMTSQLATRQDLELLRHDMTPEFALVREELRSGLALLRAGFKQDLAQQTVKLGMMMASGLTLLFAALKLGAVDPTRQQQASPPRRLRLRTWRAGSVAPTRMRRSNPVLAWFACLRLCGS